MYLFLHLYKYFVVIKNILLILGYIFLFYRTTQFFTHYAPICKNTHMHTHVHGYYTQGSVASTKRRGLVDRERIRFLV